MKYLIVNGDDYGASRGITSGILDALERGILTSASLMVNMPVTVEAVERARSRPHLSVGLHVNLTNEGGPPIVDLADPAACGKELERQLQLFVGLVGRAPTHLDSHHNVHLLPQLEPVFVELAQQSGMFLRGRSPARYHRSFYGQWDGESHPEQISVESLQRMLTKEIVGRVTELSCHPGYVDPDFASVYHREREIELATLCDPSLDPLLREQGIELVGFADLPGVMAADGDPR